MPKANEPLPLYDGVADGLPPAVPCVQCGYCCKKTPCPFGTWDAKRKQCEHLTDDNRCAIYHDILAKPGPLWRLAPAFGAGCCMSLFNTHRIHRIRRIRAGLDLPPAGFAAGDIKR
jgi:hypothetical protein